MQRRHHLMAEDRRCFLDIALLIDDDYIGHYIMIATRQHTQMLIKRRRMHFASYFPISRMITLAEQQPPAILPASRSRAPSRTYTAPPTLAPLLISRRRHRRHSLVLIDASQNTIAQYPPPVFQPLLKPSPSPPHMLPPVPHRRRHAVG